MRLRNQLATKATITRKTMVETMKANFPSFEESVFVCPRCGTKQTPQDLVDAGAGERIDDAHKYVGFSCVGRFNEGKTGCDWTLGGLFQIHTLEILSDGEKHPFFELDVTEYVDGTPGFDFSVRRRRFERG